MKISFKIYKFCFKFGQFIYRLFFQFCLIERCRVILGMEDGVWGREMYVQFYYLVFEEDVEGIWVRGERY